MPSISTVITCPAISSQLRPAIEGVLHAGLLEVARKRLYIFPGGRTGIFHCRCRSSMASTRQRNRSRSISSAEW